MGSAVEQLLEERRLPPRPAQADADGMMPQLDLGATEERLQAGRQRLVRHLELDRQDAARVEGDFYPPGASKPEERLRFYAAQFPLVEVDSTLLRAAVRAQRRAVGRAHAGGLHLQRQGVRAADAARELPRGAAGADPQGPAGRGDRRQAADLRARTSPSTAMDARLGHVQLGARAAVPRPASWARSCSSSRTGSRPAAATSPTCASSPSARAGRRRSSSAAGAGWTRSAQERTLDLLEELGFAYVVVDEPQGFKSSVPPVVAATSPDLAMIRFHGRNAETLGEAGLTAAERFRYLYSEDELREWVGRRSASWPGSRSSCTS